TVLDDVRAMPRRCHHEPKAGQRLVPIERAARVVRDVFIPDLGLIDEFLREPDAHPSLYRGTTGEPPGNQSHDEAPSARSAGITAILGNKHRNLLMISGRTRKRLETR